MADVTTWGPPEDEQMEVIFRCSGVSQKQRLMSAVFSNTILYALTNCK